MIGNLDPLRKDVLVIGGGFAGLLAAYHFDRLGYRVTLIEAQNRLGGMIQTDQTLPGIVEHGAHSLLATPPVLDLCRELGIELLAVQRKARSRYILRDGRLRRFPLRVGEFIHLLRRVVITKNYAPKSDLISWGAKSPPTLQNQPGETLAQWGERFLGRAAVDYLLAPFIQGIYATHPSKILFNAIFPALRLSSRGTLAGYFIKKKLGAFFVPRQFKRSARPKMMTPRGGMGTLTAALESKLRERMGDRIFTRLSVQKIHADGTVTLLTTDDSANAVADGAHFFPQSTNIVLTTPAYVAASILKESNPALADSLSEISYAPLITVTVFVKKSNLRVIPHGVGVLMPTVENRLILGILFNSSAFSHRTKDADTVSLTVMLGGTERREMLRATDSEIQTIIAAELSSLFGHSGDPDVFIHRWAKAIPLYDQALQNSWDAARMSWCEKPGHILFGNYTGKVSLRGMIEKMAAYTTFLTSTASADLHKK